MGGRQFPKPLTKKPQAPKVAAIQGSAALPWYQSTLLWASISIFAAIVLTVVAAMMKDLRWLLIIAWPFACLAAWEFGGYFPRLKARRKAVTLVVGVMAAVLLLGLDIKLPAPKETASARVIFHALTTGIGNLPDRKRVSVTWDGKPWDEAHYADVRLSIENTSDFPLQNLDLNISAADGKDHARIAGIGQLTDVKGVDFHPPRTPDLSVGLRGTDGKVYHFPFTDMLGWIPAIKFRVFCPRLLPRQTLRLIIAVIGGPTRPPKQLQLTGTYETAPSEGSTRGQINETVGVVQ